MDRRLERVVARRLVQRPLVERLRLSASRLDLGKLDEHYGALRPGGGLDQNALQQLVRPAGRAGDGVEVGGKETTPTGVVAIRVMA